MRRARPLVFTIALTLVRCTSGPGSSSERPTCFVDSPCFRRTTQCAGPTSYTRVESHHCSLRCGSQPCSGGSCDAVGAPIECPAGHRCVDTSERGEVLGTGTACVLPGAIPDASPDASSDASSDAPAGDGATAPTAAETLITREVFEQLFLHRGTAPCRGAFYTYDALVAALRTFPAFAAEGTDAVRRRELAAFLANIAHETTGGWDTAPDGRSAWGLCWITEGATVDPATLDTYCASSSEWPCVGGRKYFGRGPIQLSWNYNYGQAGRALGLNLLSDPDLVATDPVVAFRTALWFWMTPQAPKPSCHEVMTGAWTPSAEDARRGRAPGFGATVNVINGGLECGMATTPAVQDRIGFYTRFSMLLATTPGDNLTCEAMGSY